MYTSNEVLCLAPMPLMHGAYCFPLQHGRTYSILIACTEQRLPEEDPCWASMHYTCGDVNTFPWPMRRSAFQEPQVLVFALAITD